MRSAGPGRLRAFWIRHRTLFWSLHSLWALTARCSARPATSKITTHEAGFRVWDAWRSGADTVPAGEYDVTVRTADGRVFGRADIAVRAS